MENAFDRFGLHCNLQYLCPHLKLHLDAIYAWIYVTFSYPVPMRNINLRKSTSAVEIGCEAWHHPEFTAYESRGCCPLKKISLVRIKSFWFSILVQFSLLENKYPNKCMNVHKYELMDQIWRPNFLFFFRKVLTYFHSQILNWAKVWSVPRFSRPNEYGIFFSPSIAMFGAAYTFVTWIDCPSSIATLCAASTSWKTL